MNGFEELPAPLPGVRLLRPRVFADQRGSFVKTYHESDWKQAGLDFTLREEYYSVSNRGVIRGMHFQVPPADHHKIVSCIGGRVLDVVLDLRRRSPAYGQCASFELSADKPMILYLPPGFAHGFSAQEDRSVLLYKTSTTHSPDHDAGIRWDSFGFDWRAPDPVLSDRDRSFRPFAEFTSPFA